MAEYIEREKTVELLRSLGNRGYRKEKGTIQDAIKMISFPEYTPSADVAQVVHGRWKRYGKNLGECSECGEVVSVRNNYCPNCGAKMDIKDGGADNAGD